MRKNNRIKGGNRNDKHALSLLEMCFGESRLRMKACEKDDVGVTPSLHCGIS